MRQIRHTDVNRSLVSSSIESHIVQFRNELSHFKNKMPTFYSVRKGNVHFHFEDH